MIGYVTLGSDDLERARGFFDALLAPLGAKRMMQMGEEDGGFTLWGMGFDKPGIAVTRPYDKSAAHCGNGNMVALVLDARDKVDALHASALALGGSDEGAPGYRGSPAMGFYAAYFRDPDGHKFAAYCLSPQG